MGKIRFPELLKNEFEVVEDYHRDTVLQAFRVKERGGARREFMLRLLSDSLWADESVVESFHEFFERFSQISNKTYIPAVYSVVGALNNPIYVLEEYVSGRPIGEFIRDHKDSADFKKDVLDALNRVCEALHYAHQKNIFHLCITPEDILIKETTGKVKLVGFGAQIFHAAARLNALPIQATKRMAPEVLAGKQIGAFSDVYSLAHTMNEICPDIFSGTDVLARALSPSHSERYQKARDFEKALADVFRTSKTPSPYESPKPMESAGGLKPVADISLRSVPSGATVKVDGLSAGTTTETGLVIPWNNGMMVVVEKPGYEKETIRLKSRPSDRDMAITLKPMMVNVRTNPPGAVVRVNGQFLGTIGNQGLGVPWDQGEITVEKEGFKKETFKFDSVPSNWEIMVNLVSSVSWYSLRQSKIQLAVGAAVVLLSLFVGLAVYRYQDDKRHATQQNEAQRLAALEREKQDKDKEIQKLRETQIREAQEKAQIEREKQEKEQEIARLKEAEQLRQLLEKERLDRERVERERQEKEKEIERLKEAQRHKEQERERLEKERQEKARIEAERQEKEILDREREMERLKVDQKRREEEERERNEKLKESQRLEALYRERLDREKLEKEREESELPAFARNYPDEVKNELRRALRGNARAQTDIGIRYSKGNGVPKDDAEAVRWYRKAADQGNVVAQANLGYMYENGRGVSKDYTEAVKWFRKAADQGHPIGQANLGVMYANGWGVPKDDAEAVRWYRKAADQGYVRAQASLGYMYETGRGVSKDESEAVKWYRKSAEQGDTTAQWNLDRIEKTARGSDPQGTVNRALSTDRFWFVNKKSDGVCLVIELKVKTPKTIAGPFTTKAEAQKAKNEICP